MKLFLTSAIKMISLGLEINPRVIEFGLHFVSGKQTDMTLNSTEIEYTKHQILNSLNYEIKKIEFLSGNQDSFVKGVIGVANVYDSHLKDEQETLSWFTHPTMGLVGGFNFNLTINENEDIIAKCVDTWDFNPGNAYIVLELNPKFQTILEKLSGLLKIPVRIDKDIEKNKITLIVIENDLLKLNEGHSFQTKWEVNLGKKTLFESQFGEHLDIVYI